MTFLISKSRPETLDLIVQIPEPFPVYAACVVLGIKIKNGIGKEKSLMKFLHPLR